MARVDLGWGCILVCMRLVVSVGGRTVLVVVMVLVVVLVVLVDGWMADGGVRDNSHRRAIVTYKYYRPCTSLQYIPRHNE